MAKRATLRLTVDGADALARKLDPEHLYGRPVDGLLEAAARRGEQEASKRAPRRSGQLVGSIRSQLHAVATPPYATVTANAVARDGFRYGYALDASPRYHYAGKRRQTRGWFTKVPAIVRRIFGAIVKKAEKEIQAGFDAGGTIGGSGGTRAGGGG
jgi:hypothetical protein